MYLNILKYILFTNEKMDGTSAFLITLEIAFHLDAGALLGVICLRYIRSDIYRLLAIQIARKFICSIIITYIEFVSSACEF